MNSQLKNFTNAALIVFWWIGLWGATSVVVDMLKLTPKQQLWVYLGIVLVSTLLIYTLNQRSIILLD